MSTDNSRAPTNAYRKLVSNTMLFGLSTFGSRLLPFLMMPLYTRVFTQAEFGLRDLLTASANLMVPIISLCIHEAVIRFGMEKETRRTDVFTTSMVVIFCGYGVLLLAWPLVGLIEHHAGYMVLLYIFTLTAALRSTVTHFVRASGFVKLFALDGVFTTVLTVALIVIFIVPLEMGVGGFLLATIIADGFSALSQILFLRLYRFFSLGQLRMSTLKAMLRYSVPLMPTAVFWWVTNLSDKYFVTFMVGLEATGLYGAAGVVPRVITLVSTIFIQAWQISAFTEYKSPAGERFYSTVFRSYYTLVFLAASGIILLVRPIMTVLVSPYFFPSWQYVPFLVLAVGFSCLVTFLGTIYNAHKRNSMVTVTTFIGAVVNIALNLLLIPRMGVQGAALGTFISFFLVFIIRAVDTRRYMKIAMQPMRIALTLALLLAQIWVTLTQPTLWPVWSSLGFLLILLCNAGNVAFLLRSAMKLLHRRRA
ncbi:MAG: polysaccharide biosynthesis C-terminal domain-containing protein [Oscillospiraceae bacterium]|nr:polysaccharide biosynthesis C-terminal domain-containing protein [Oscillospiraceae bacterium]